jgi:hypothetical protein
MALHATFNNISIISWWSVLLVEETRVPGENHRPAASHWQTLSHNVASITPSHERDSNSQHLVVICTDCIGSCKSKHHTITTTTAPGTFGNQSFTISISMEENDSVYKNFEILVAWTSDNSNSPFEFVLCLEKTGVQFMPGMTIYFQLFNWFQLFSSDKNNPKLAVHGQNL